MVPEYTRPPANITVACTGHENLLRWKQLGQNTQEDGEDLVLQKMMHDVKAQGGLCLKVNMIRHGACDRAICALVHI